MEGPLDFLWSLISYALVVIVFFLSVGFIKRLILRKTGEKLFAAQADQAIASIAALLLEERDIPYETGLDRSKLDFSLGSLHVIDSYLEKIRARKNEFSDEQLTKVVLRCGAYTGEVIKKNLSVKRCWITYKDFIEKHPEMKDSIPESLGTAGVLFAESGDFSFPFGKVLKFLENGPGDSLYYFVKLLEERVPSS